MIDGTGIVGFICYRLCADGGGFFELLGPVLIFGVYIIAAIAKSLRKKDTEESGEKSESELKKAVMKRRQQIYEQQVGKSPRQAPPQAIPSGHTGQMQPKISQIRQKVMTQWDRKQQVIQQKMADMRTQLNMKRDPLSVPTQQTQYHRYTPKQQRRPKKAAPKPDKSVKLKKKTLLQKTPETKKIGTATKGSPYSQLFTMMRQPDNLRSAIILKEILDKPMGLREGFEY